MKSPETRLRLSEASKRAWADPEKHARISQASKRALADPAVRARISEATKRAMANPEVRACLSERMKRAWADPEVRARMSEALKRGWSERHRVQVPAWVQRAGLEEDFRDITAMRGEEEAAAHCRALKRAMETQGGSTCCWRKLNT